MNLKENRERYREALGGGKGEYDVIVLYSHRMKEKQLKKYTQKEVKKIPSVKKSEVNDYPCSSETRLHFK